MVDCNGMGNINKPNFGGTHSSERSCPKKLQNNLLQSEQTIETPRNENLDLKISISKSSTEFYDRIDRLNKEVAQLKLEKRTAEEKVIQL